MNQDQVYKDDFLVNTKDMKFVWDIIFLLPFIYGFYLFIKTPMANKYQAPTWSDPLAGFSLTLVTLVYFYFAHFAASLVPDSDYAPCGRLSKQIECYNLSEETCMSAWSSSDGDCAAQLEEIRIARPSALMGAFLEVCIGRNFDKVMHYNRKNESNPACQGYFRKIDRKD